MTMQTSPEIGIRRLKWLDVRSIDFVSETQQPRNFSLQMNQEMKQRNESYSLEETMPKPSCVAQGE